MKLWSGNLHLGYVKFAGYIVSECHNNSFNAWSLRNEIHENLEHLSDETDSLVFSEQRNSTLNQFKAKVTL